MITSLRHSLQKGYEGDVRAQLMQREERKQKIVLQIIQKILFNGGSATVAKIVVEYSAPWQRFLSYTINKNDIVDWFFNQLLQQTQTQVSLYIKEKKFIECMTHIEIFTRYGILDARYDEQQNKFGSLVAIQQLFVYSTITRKHEDWMIFELVIKKIESPDFERNIPNDWTYDQFNPVVFCNSFYQFYEEHAIYYTKKLFFEFKLTMEKLDALRQQIYFLVKKMNTVLLKDGASPLEAPLFIEKIYNHYSTMKQSNGYSDFKLKIYI